ncbi:MAG: HPr family phosphocarrier protein [Phycisphaerae bacterium]|nr:HPr family phosphocarrier protein [Phycisphaerae bacterium]NUQ47623.1 HPr family phosphocarrier protein [Phycisphaerae bacterium]
MNGACERELEIVNTQGLHARPVMRIVDLAVRFKSRIRISKGDRVADANSAMEMMLLEAPMGTRLKIVAEGEDAEEAVAAIAQLVADKFHEE